VGYDRSACNDCPFSDSYSGKYGHSGPYNNVILQSYWSASFLEVLVVNIMLHSENPYFSGEGPWYHMLVLTGYGWWDFITNDPGTRRGAGYEYRFSTLLNAIHDWTGIKEEIRKGRSAVLVLDSKSPTPYALPPTPNAPSSSGSSGER